ncbi:MAG: GNAT family acetyltransferase [Clostridiales bacterium]|nr:GNAT family acetyltransferase [Clostridiales bacterium]
MIERIDLFHLPFYKKEAFTGSDRGVRFWIGKAEVPREGSEGEKDTVLRVIVWEEPFALAHTEEDKKHTKDFPFSEEGLDQIYDWILGEGRELIMYSQGAP